MIIMMSIYKTNNPNITNGDGVSKKIKLNNIKSIVIGKGYNNTNLNKIVIFTKDGKVVVGYQSIRNIIKTLL